MKDLLNKINKNKDSNIVNLMFPTNYIVLDVVSKKTKCHIVITISELCESGLNKISDLYNKLPFLEAEEAYKILYDFIIKFKGVDLEISDDIRLNPATETEKQLFNIYKMEWLSRKLKN